MKLANVFLIVMFLILSGCKKGNDYTPVLDDFENEKINLKSSLTSDLINDEDFIAYIQELFDFNFYLIEAINQSSFNFDYLMEKLQDISDDFPGDIESQFTEIGKLFDDEGIFEDRFRSNIERTAYYDNLLYLRYGPINDNAEEAIGDLIDNGLIDVYSCGWRYNLCIAAAFTAGVLCHAGCASTMIVAPACMAMCLVGQAYLSVECWDTYCS